MKKTGLTLMICCGLLMSFNACKKDDKNTPSPGGTANQGTPKVLDCNINSDMILTDHNKAGYDYIVDCDVEVKSGLLKIEPGVSIQFKNNSSLQINKDGAISVAGTSNAPVIMKGETTGACWWGIKIISKDARNQINHLQISNTGYGNWFSDVFAGFIYDAKFAIAVTGSASITNTKVDDCAGIGIIYGTESSITGFGNNAISNCKLYPLMIGAYMLNENLDLTTSTFQNNQENVIALYSHTSNNVVDNQVRFKKTTIPYYAYNSFEFRQNTTFDAGVEIIMSDNNFLMSTGVNTNWHINGTQANPVTIRGEASQPGYWRGILVGSKSNGVFNYLNISDGGSDFISFNQAFKANINVGNIDAAHLVINNCESSNNAAGCDVGVADNGSTLTNNSPGIASVCTE